MKAPARKTASASRPRPLTSFQALHTSFAPGEAALLQRQYGNAHLGRLLGARESLAPPSQETQALPGTFVQRALASQRAPDKAAAGAPSRDAFFRTSAAPALGPVQGARVARSAQGAFVQRKFFGTLAKMTDSEIFAAIQQEHPQVPDRILRLIGVYRRAKTKRFGTIGELIESLDKSSWAQESIEEGQRAREELRSRIKKQVRKARIEQKEAEEKKQKTSKMPGRVGTGMQEGDFELKGGKKLYVPEMIDETSLTLPSEKGTLTADTSGVAFNEPKTGSAVFSSAPTPYLNAIVNGKPYRLRAGQNYLNTETSASYKADPSSIWPKVVPLARSNEGDKEPEKPPVRMVGDGHHRLIWTAFFHKLPVEVELQGKMAVMPFGQTLNDWPDLTYKDDPKKEVKDAPPLGELKEKILREWASRELGFAKFAGPAERARNFMQFVEAMAKHHNYNLASEIKEAIARHLEEQLPDRKSAIYKTFLETLVGQCINKEVAIKTQTHLLDLLKTKASSIAVILGPTESVGFFDGITNTITLDPVKNPGADALLDTLSFESQNASQRTELSTANKTEDEVERGKKVVKIEFGSDDRYVKSLIKNFDATDLDDLVRNKLKVPPQFLEKSDYEKVKGSTKKVEMPERSVMPQQNMRESLWFWKTSEWTPQQQEEIWGGTEHAEGMKASTSTYGDKDKSEGEEKKPEEKKDNKKHEQKDDEEDGKGK